MERHLKYKISEFINVVLHPISFLISINHMHPHTSRQIQTNVFIYRLSSISILHPPFFRSFPFP